MLTKSLCQSDQFNGFHTYIRIGIITNTFGGNITDSQEVLYR